MLRAAVWLVAVEKEEEEEEEEKGRGEVEWEREQQQWQVERVPVMGTFQVAATEKRARQRWPRWRSSWRP